MKTAVEWLAEQVNSAKWKWADITDRNAIIEQAKEMEKEQIVNAHYQGYRPSIGTTEISEKYFNETFKQQEQ